MKLPSPEEVRLIFKDAYLFYLKHKDNKLDSEFEDMHKDVKEFLQNHPYDMSKTYIFEIMTLINEYELQSRQGR